MEEIIIGIIIGIGFYIVIIEPELKKLYSQNSRHQDKDSQYISNKKIKQQKNDNNREL